MQVARPTPRPNRRVWTAGLSVFIGLAFGFLQWFRQVESLPWRCPPDFCIGWSRQVDWRAIVVGGVVAMLVVSFLLARRPVRVRGTSRDLALGRAFRHRGMFGRDGLPRVAAGRALRRELRGRSARERGRLMWAALSARTAGDRQTARLVGGYARGLLRPLRSVAGPALFAALFMGPLAWEDPNPAPAWSVALLVMLGVVTLALRHQLKRAYALNAGVADPF